MKVSSVINGLTLKCNLQAAATHAEVHRVHVDFPRVFLKKKGIHFVIRRSHSCARDFSRPPRVLLFFLLKFLLADVIRACKALTGIDILENGNKNLNLSSSVFANRLHQARKAGVWILCSIDGEFTLRKSIYFLEFSAGPALLDLRCEDWVCNFYMISGPENDWGGN